MSKESENKDYNERVVVKKLGAIFVAAFLFVFLVVALFNCFYTLDVEHAAVITTFGKPEAETAPGLHAKIPFVQEVEKVDTTIKGMAIGYDIETNANIGSESVMISSDYNFLNVDFYLEYQVSDPVKYLYNSSDPIAILKAVTQNAIRTVIASYKVDAVITTGKSEIQSNIKSMLIEKTDELDIGITVRNITIQDSEPPTAEVVEAFKAVETAKQGKETAINNANKYRNEQIPAAEAEVDRIIQEAEAEKANRIAEANGQVARFNDMYEEYIKYPSVTRQRMFYESMEEVLPSLKVIIQSNGEQMQSILPLESFTGGTENDIGNEATSGTTGEAEQ